MRRFVQQSDVESGLCQPEVLDWRVEAWILVGVLVAALALLVDSSTLDWSEWLFIALVLAVSVIALKRRHDEMTWRHLRDQEFARMEEMEVQRASAKRLADLRPLPDAYSHQQQPGLTGH